MKRLCAHKRYDNKRTRILPPSAGPQLQQHPKTETNYQVISRLPCNTMFDLNFQLPMVHRVPPPPGLKLTRVKAELCRVLGGHWPSEWLAQPASPVAITRIIRHTGNMHL